MIKRNSWFIPVRVLIVSALMIFLDSNLVYGNFKKCAPVEELSQMAIDCDDNDQFLEAAKVCLQSFEEKIGPVANETQGVLSLQNKTPRKKNGQNSDHLRVKEISGFSSKVIGELLDSAVIVEASLIDYFENLFYPEDFDAPEEVIGSDPIQFMMDQNCYGNPKREIDAMLSKIDKHINSLDKAENIALENEKSSLTLSEKNSSLSSSTQTSSPGAQEYGSKQEKGHKKNKSKITKNKNLKKKKL